MIIVTNFFSSMKPPGVKLHWSVCVCVVHGCEGVTIFQGVILIFPYILNALIFCLHPLLSSSICTEKYASSSENHKSRNKN